MTKLRRRFGEMLDEHTAREIATGIIWAPFIYVIIKLTEREIPK